MRTSRVPEVRCPKCQKRLSAASSIKHEEPPEAGSVTICLYCGHVMIFQEDKTLRPATQAEIEDLKSNNSEFRRMVSLLAKFRKMQNAELS
jgi:RNase P subunit RPR2